MGKAAPPSPTIPASLTISIISPPEMDSTSLSLTFSHSSLPSLVINTDSISPPDGCGCVSIFFTSPDTGECILADMNPVISPIFVPICTLLPFSTMGFEGEPVCWERGTMISSGGWISVIFLSSVIDLFSLGWMPPGKVYLFIECDYNIKTNLCQGK